MKNINKAFPARFRVHMLSPQVRPPQMLRFCGTGEQAKDISGNNETLATFEGNRGIKTIYWETGMTNTNLAEGAELQGGGTLNFSTYVGSGPASTLHPPKISGISSTHPKKLKF